MRKKNDAVKTIEVKSRQDWRKWLNENYDSQSEVWLVFRKRHTGVTTISYTEAIEEAICYGWIDSLVKKLDSELYARKFTQRKAESKWSTINRRRYADLEARGLLAAPGLERAPTNRSGDAPRPSVSMIPPYIEKRFKTNRLAWQYFEGLAPSYRRAYIAWIEAAKREETKEKRLREALSLLAEGKKLGLK